MSTILFIGLVISLGWNFVNSQEIKMIDDYLDRLSWRLDDNQQDMYFRFRDEVVQRRASIGALRKRVRQLEVPGSVLQLRKEDIVK